MQRYDTKLEDGTLLLESDDGWLEIGSMAAIEELCGGPTYEIEYDDRQAKAPWIEEELDDQTLTFDVRETLLEMDFNDEFVADIEDHSLEETSDDGHPARTVAFAEKMLEIWDAQGGMVAEEDEAE